MLAVAAGAADGLLVALVEGVLGVFVQGGDEHDMVGAGEVALGVISICSWIGCWREVEVDLLASGTCTACVEH